MSNFEQHLKDIIRENGPVTVAAFMAMAIEHYYSTRDPLGTRGDFTTAPEISQMFGEMIGVFLAQSWMELGSPAQFSLVEAGPGRGTLMADILRATKSVPGFHAAMRVHLVEISPVLMARQAEALQGYNIEWHTDIHDALASPAPALFVANEFLDALPVHQYVRQGGRWFERAVGLNGDQLAFGLIESDFSCDQSEENKIWEVSPARESVIRDIAGVIARCRGVALLIDYGHDRSGFGDTLQAVREHHFVNVLDHVGNADLTSHIDFQAIKGAAVLHTHVHGPVGQGHFLRNLGIELRAARLNQPAEMARLIDPGQMGDLFRVMALCHDPDLKLPGF